MIIKDSWEFRGLEQDLKISYGSGLIYARYIGCHDAISESPKSGNNILKNSKHAFFLKTRKNQSMPGICVKKINSISSTSECNGGTRVIAKQK